MFLSMDGQSGPARAAKFRCATAHVAVAAKRAGAGRDDDRRQRMMHARASSTHLHQWTSVLRLDARDDRN